MQRKFHLNGNIIGIRPQIETIEWNHPQSYSERIDITVHLHLKLNRLHARTWTAISKPLYPCQRSAGNYRRRECTTRYSQRPLHTGTFYAPLTVLIDWIWPYYILTLELYKRTLKVPYKLVAGSCLPLPPLPPELVFNIVWIPRLCENGSRCYS